MNPAHKKAFASRLGPGLITGAADDDPSGIATYSQAGAQFPLRAGLDAVPDDAADDRHPDALGADRLRHARGPGLEHRQDVPALDDDGPDRPARRRQHDQHRRRRRRDGGGAEALRRRPAAALRARLRALVHQHADLLLVRAIGSRAEVVDAGPLRLRRRDPRRVGAVEDGDRRIAAALEALSERRLGQGLRVDGRRRAGHHDQPLSLLLAGVAGGGRQPSPARGAGAARTTRNTSPSICRGSSRTPSSA